MVAFDAVVMGKRAERERAERERSARRFYWGTGLAVGALALVAYLNHDDGKDRTKGGQKGAWSAAERDEARAVCRRHASTYGESTCRVDRFCTCAVDNYESRGPFREFRDSLAPAVAAYIRPGAYGYFCTARAASACGERE